MFYFLAGKFCYEIAKADFLLSLNILYLHIKIINKFNNYYI